MRTENFSLFTQIQDRCKNTYMRTGTFSLFTEIQASWESRGWNVGSGERNNILLTLERGGVGWLAGRPDGWLTTGWLTDYLKNMGYNKHNMGYNKHRV